MRKMVFLSLLLLLLLAGCTSSPQQTVTLAADEHCPISHIRHAARATPIGSLSPTRTHWRIFRAIAAAATWATPAT